MCSLEELTNKARIEPSKSHVHLGVKIRMKTLKVFLFLQIFCTDKFNELFLLALKDLEKKAFQVCDEDQDGGLTWDEVSKCEVSFLNLKLDL